MGKYEHSKVTDFSIGKYHIVVSLTNVIEALEYYDLEWRGGELKNPYYLEYHVTDRTTNRTIEYKVFMGKDLWEGIQKFGSIEKFFEHIVNMLQKKYENTRD